MKTMNMLIGTGLLCLVHMTSYAASLDVPDDLKTHAYRVEFLANMARRCDLRLSIFGKDGLSDPICRDFIAKVTPVITVDPKTTERWETISGQVDRSTNGGVHMQWNAFYTQLLRDLKTIGKTQDHILFLRP